MAILVNKDSKVVVQGITGREGSFHTKLMIEYGTKIVAGVTPGKGGSEVHGIPVYDSIESAMKEHEIDASIIFVPANFALSAVYEAIDAGLSPIVVITEGIPVWDTMKFVNKAKSKGLCIIGPNCPGIIVPEETKIGIMPGHVFTKGDVAIISRSGTLTYEVAQICSLNGLGQSVVIGLGGDPIRGLTIPEALKMLESDPETKKIVIIGEIGGTEEEEAAELIKKGEITKPTVAYIAGATIKRTGVSFGHAGAIILGEKGKPETKIKAFQEAGVPVVRFPHEIPDALKEL
ncbi:MAG: succinate--CoA ligase subunit alpha [Crenarchaeota archaeon]|nr:succinate--CoA ligase subunit alpha [Thermoproteota archaeon]MCR8453876.1 succinate--CoA ligase subunit alpha [Thermoproteota archaeon]MCR8455305.1 succinate--CoA ligase subunit alpha [Thermoproteota archaeon]MCR8462575.1 succinate--CoA ligase subunit alpha [Thermoproteota archaeon]MCR8470697.1 succinate--CoA ligase subunit alpha [Thermoproteota archaeon]